MTRSSPRTLWCLVLAAACALVACEARSPVRAPSMSVVDTNGTRTSLPGDLARSKLTVVVFYADRCPCFRAHEERIRELSRTYASRGVAFLLVDSEVGATMERATAAVRERDLPPIAIDPGGRLAGALGAEYATYSVVLDPNGEVLYRGGIDSDKNRLTDEPQEYLREALDDLLAGREPRRKEGKTLGCALQTR
ncbi:MAG: redoxin domain-containing protein [Myxococcales bacterium]|nr:redoxin domain-containing protein [Myxococcales bacterium]